MRITKYLILILVFALGSPLMFTQEESATDEPATAPEPAISVEGDEITLGIYDPNLLQGRAGVIRLRGMSITEAQADIFSRQFDFFYVPEEDAWFALIVARMDQPIRKYDLVVSVVTENQNEAQILQSQVNVVNGRFIQQEVILPPDEALESLLDPQIEADELALLFRLAEPVQERLWDEHGFIAPLNSELTSPFGAVRVFNDTLDSVHTGWDFRAEIGDLMVATANGQVAFAGTLPLRGNYVLIDHGRGVYSGYAHLSVRFMTQGQFVHQGQIVGRVGSTGRSSSAHAHIEFIVAGQWVDAADFLRIYLP